MRIVSGFAKGRVLQSPSWEGLRPTTDKVRNAIFAALGSAMPEGYASVLDLFAGTGALGLEALSRGAQHAVFVEKNPKAVALIKSNIEICYGHPENTRVFSVSGSSQETANDKPSTRVLRGDVMRVIRDVGEFDVAFVDPPYAFADHAWTQLTSHIRSRYLVCESNRTVARLLAESWNVIRDKRYGDTTVVIARSRSSASVHEARETNTVKE